jgi:hypothetical protein
LTRDDLVRLEALHPLDIALADGPISWLFDRRRSEAMLTAFVDLDRRLAPLLEYRQFDFWVYEEHRNLVQMVEHLRETGSRLDPRSLRHLALVIDCAWLYLIALARAIEHLRSVHPSDLDLGLQEYVLGGAHGLSEKRQLSSLLADLRQRRALPEEVNIDLFPPYFPMLRELAMRVMRRPDAVLPALRYLELVAHCAALGEHISTFAAFGQAYDPLAAKQAADVIGFLVSAAGLDADFRTRSRSMLLDEPPVSGAVAAAPEGDYRAGSQTERPAPPLITSPPGPEADDVGQLGLLPPTQEVQDS